MDNEIFIGYLVNEQGQYREGTRLNGSKEVGDFFLHNVEKTYEIRVTDTDDIIVFHVFDKRLLFPLPENMSLNNKWNNELKKFVNCQPD